MTTKYKIVSGFVLMVFLLAGLAVLSNTTLAKIATGISTYSRLAHVNVATSNIDACMNAMSFGIFRFLDTHDPEDIALARKELAEAAKTLANSKKQSRLPETLDMIAGMEKHIQSLQKILDGFEQKFAGAAKIYGEAVLPAMASLTQSLEAMANQAVATNNIQLMQNIFYLRGTLALGRISLAKFSESRSPEDIKAVRSSFADADAAMKKMEGSLSSAESKNTLAKVMLDFAKMNQDVAEMEALLTDVEKRLQELSATSKTTRELAFKLSSFVDKIMEASDREMTRTIASSEQQTFVVGIGGVLLGLAFAGFLIYGIVRVLREAGKFAGAVARGDFTHAVAVKEGGEIGDMIAAMRQIPAVLERLVEQANALANSVLSGHLRERMDDTAFSGSFSSLTKAVNTVSGAYTNVVDSLSIPIMCCDKKQNVLFLSERAQQVMGDNAVGKHCADALKPDVGSKDTYFSERVLAQNALVKDETTIHPQGTTIPVSVIATPLHNYKREPVGFMAVFSDLTEIKSKQATMQRVAREAEEIAARVAAASEELAAQVDHVARGAEMQRERMESTATAMNEMNSTVLEVARNAGHASEQSEETRKKADNGSELVNKVVYSINGVNTVALGLQNNMTELGKQAESIGGVMNVISDIADQTNLLALNAAIEAARAGEAGRGFAVVADEVRKLAEKTMQATQEVGSNIQAIQHSARTNIGEVTNAVKNIGEATELANASGQALHEIVELASSNSSVVASIAAAAEEQSATSEEISRAIDEINKVVSETADGMVQSSAAVQDLSRQAQELQRVMEGLK
ncbi:MAG: methyl-accepting chemotaxis protein [Deltaproteobacteria bacterium]|jgi:methyl-accepting chemotaxis protein|nr:methyl-accepting chemotaxis protein [Deltaproteobacteria bacterium]